MKENGGSMHEKTMKAQRNFVRVLKYQAFVPITVFCIPLAVGCGITWFGSSSFSGAGVLMTMSMSLMPLLNELCVLILLPNYRRRLYTLGRYGNNSSIATRTNTEKSSAYRSKH